MHAHMEGQAESEKFLLKQPKVCCFDDFVTREIVKPTTGFVFTHFLFTTWSSMVKNTT